MKIPITIQMQPGENGAAALCMMLGYYGRFVPLAEMREECVSSRNGSSPKQLINAAEKYGLTGELHEMDIDELKKQAFPVMVHWKKKYYAIIKAIKKDVVYIVDPSRGEYKLPLVAFERHYSGKTIFFSKSESFVKGGKRESLFKLLIGRVKPIIKPMVGLLILSVICIELDLQLSKITKVYMDENMSGSPDAKDITLVLLYLCMIGYALFTAIRTNLILSTSRNSSAVSGSKLFKNMFAQPMKFFEQYSAGELMTRIENNAKLDNSIMQSLVPRFIDAFMTIIYFVVLMRYNYVITLICLAIEIINILVTLYFQERNAIISKSMATTSGTLKTSILNGMNMIDTIKSTGAERSFYNIWYESQEQVCESKKLKFKLNSITSLTNGIHSFLIQGVQLFVGAYFIKHGHFTLGTLALFQSVMSNMRSSLNNCLNTVDTLQTMRTNIERVDDINERPIREEIPIPKDDLSGVDKLRGHIVVDHVVYRYNKGDDPAVNDVSMEIMPGQMVAIVGETGCGKSTLLKIMADLYSAESGQILYGGKRRDEIPDVVFRSSVSSVDQETVMFEDSVYANIKMWDSTIEDYEVILAAYEAQIHNRIIRDRTEYGTIMKENGGNYSGGELQRLELARALAHDPTILFLDEFTSALDALTEDKVIKNIRRKGITTVIVAHRLSTIVDADMIYVMEKGKIIQKGTHSELYAQEGLYRTLIGSQ